MSVQTKTETAYFGIQGDFITQTARNLVIEGRHEDALRLLVENFGGMTWDIAIQILQGKKKMTGVSNGPDNQTLRLASDGADDKETAEYLVDVQNFYCGRFRSGEQWFRPYAKVTNLGKYDVDRLDRVIETQLHNADASSSLPTGPDYRWSLNRALVYANSPSSDKASTQSVEGSHVWILFEQCNPPPPWLSRRNNNDEEAVRDWLAHGNYLEERGAHQFRVPVKVAEGRFEAELADLTSGDVPGTDLKRAIQAATNLDRLRREEEREKVYLESLIRYRREIRDQAGPEQNDENWFTMNVGGLGHEVTFSDKKTCVLCGATSDNEYDLEEQPCLERGLSRSYRIPRAPFENWSLRRTEAAHLARPWGTISPVGLKMMNDDSYHSDWMLGAIPDIDLAIWGGMDADKVLVKAAYRESFKLQADKTHFQVHVLCGQGVSSGRVVHPEPGEVVPEGSIIVIPSASVDYEIAALSVGETGVIITERGGPLAHLVLVGRESGLNIVRVKNAMSLYPVGVLVRVDCSEGKILSGEKND